MNFKVCATADRVTLEDDRGCAFVQQRLPTSKCGNKVSSRSARRLTKVGRRAASMRHPSSPLIAWPPIATATCRTGQGVRSRANGEQGNRPFEATTRRLDCQTRSVPPTMIALTARCIGGAGALEHESNQAQRDLEVKRAGVPPPPLPRALSFSNLAHSSSSASLASSRLFLM